MVADMDTHWKFTHDIMGLIASPMSSSPVGENFQSSQENLLTWTMRGFRVSMEVTASRAVVFVKSGSQTMQLEVPEEGWASDSVADAVIRFARDARASAQTASRQPTVIVIGIPEGLTPISGE